MTSSRALLKLKKYVTIIGFSRTLVHFHIPRVYTAPSIFFVLSTQGKVGTADVELTFASEKIFRNFLKGKDLKKDFLTRKLKVRISAVGVG